MADKYKATWVSHSSISDFLTCPRAYYLKNVYKDPKTKHKIQLISPPLALGAAVHSVIEALSVIPADQRFAESLIKKFDQEWKKFSGIKGGFFDEETEMTYKERGAEMLRKVMNNPGPLSRLAVKIKEDLPWFWLSEKEEIILCGKIDWLEYLPDEDKVHIIDFKTGKNDEKEDSLQLPIYYLLVHYCQHREVAKASYWYLESSDEPVEQKLPDLAKAEAEVLAIAKKIKTVRKLEHFKCPHGESGCWACRPMERILKGEAQLVGENDYHQDVYVLPSKKGKTVGEESSKLI
jgi:ATP-dependent helicase/DNAse subunit B